MSINAVAPLAGAWIEIALKHGTLAIGQVAPLAGAWIEIITNPTSALSSHVAPLAGAWIEITMTYWFTKRQLSLHSRERGLKLKVIYTF